MVNYCSSQTEVLTTPHAAPISWFLHPRSPPHYSKCPAWKSPRSSATSSRRPSLIPSVGNRLSLLIGQNGWQSFLLQYFFLFYVVISLYLSLIWWVINSSGQDVCEFHFFFAISTVPGRGEKLGLGVLNARMFPLGRWVLGRGFLWGSLCSRGPLFGLLLKPM